MPESTDWGLLPMLDMAMEFVVIEPEPEILLCWATATVVEPACRGGVAVTLVLVLASVSLLMDGMAGGH
jgi:hypothetical protein